jgi:hypothetical protein
MLNKLVRLTGRSIHKTDEYLNGNGANKPGKIEELKLEYRASRQGLVPPDEVTKDEIDLATLEWAARNGWDLPNSSS